MKKRLWLVYVFIGLFVTTSLFFIFFSSKIDLTKAIGASASFPTVIDENTIITATKNMVNENINEYNDGEVVITIKDLIKNKYLTGFEVNPATNRVYDENTRIIVSIENGTIKDAYMKNNLFKNVFSCSNVCYLNDDNYIAFNNDTYRIIKIDQEGSVYIFNNDSKTIDSKDIESTLKNYYNDLDKNIVKNVVSISLNDIENSNLIEIEDNAFVNTNTGYKLYNSITESTEDINSKESNIIPVIVLKDDITYEQGDGTKFSPYVVNK